MAIIRCKMCGADLNITPGMEICECESCGTKQTLPKFDDDRRITMFERANHFRRNSEFDKAMNMYEQILNEDRTDAEAYWSVVLCRYGIEYVEDVATHKRIPTINRAQHTSIFADEDYKEAIKNATVSQKVIFEDEAKTIDEIQKGILEISRKEQPFDVFICYKETDASGTRTRDSVLANDIYHQLTREGLKVFFAAITLEDKLGQAYEPYIFAALNSAKVMVVLGTKPEYFVAPWVKNEWSRFLHIMKDDPKKILIPAYKDMDAYDLPDEFSFLQAQDMSKIGFMNDLIHGIKKVVTVDKEDNSAAKAMAADSIPYNKVNEGSGVEQALKRAEFFLEDGDYNTAAVYYEKALDMQPECALAYVGRLMVEYEVKHREDLGKQKKPFTNNESYVRAVRFADDNLKNELQKYDYEVNNSLFLEFKQEYDNCNSEKDFENLIQKTEIIRGFEGVDNFVEECNAQKELCRKEMIYTSALTIMEQSKTIEALEKIISMFEEIPGYKDSDQLNEQCRHELSLLEVSDDKCVICREREGTRTFVPNYSEAKCCDKCLSRLNLLVQSRGKGSSIVRGNIKFLNDRMPYIAKETVRNRIRSIIESYVNSVDSFSYQDDVLKPEKEVREKTEYEIEEERKREEEEQQRKEESRRQEIESRKQRVLEKNAAYEYEVQPIIDKPGGGTDSDMMRYVLSKNAMSGWKLHSVVCDRVSDGAPVGQSILIFERRIKEEE